MALELKSEVRAVLITFLTGNHLLFTSSKIISSAHFRMFQGLNGDDSLFLGIFVLFAVDCCTCLTTYDFHFDAIGRQITFITFTTFTITFKSKTPFRQIVDLEKWVNFTDMSKTKTTKTKCTILKTLQAGAAQLRVFFKHFFGLQALFQYNGRTNVDFDPDPCNVFDGSRLNGG